MTGPSHATPDHPPTDETVGTGSRPAGRGVFDRLALGLAALVLALFGSLGGGLSPDPSGRGDGLRGQARAEAPGPDRALAGELKGERRSPDGLDRGTGGAVPPAPSVATLIAPRRGTTPPLPASTPAPVRAPDLTARTPTGPPASLTV